MEVKLLLLISVILHKDISRREENVANYPQMDKVARVNVSEVGQAVRVKILQICALIQDVANTDIV
jgi:hypothetical protein